MYRYFAQNTRLLWTNKELVGQAESERQEQRQRLGQRERERERERGKRERVRMFVKAAGDRHAWNVDQSVGWLGFARNRLQWRASIKNGGDCYRAPCGSRAPTEIAEAKLGPRSPLVGLHVKGRRRSRSW